MTGFLWVMTLLWVLKTTTFSSTGNDGGKSGLNVLMNDVTHTVVERDKLAQLAQLKSLFDSGDLSSEEYAKLKNEILMQGRRHTAVISDDRDGEEKSRQEWKERHDELESL